MPRPAKQRHASTIRKTHLKYLGVKTPTKVRYRKALRKFLDWRIKLALKPANGPYEVDEQVSEFINYLYQNDLP